MAPWGRFSGDALAADGRIAALGAPRRLGIADSVIDAGGLFLLPGLVDAHVPARDPGLTPKEDFGSAIHVACAVARDTGAEVHLRQISTAGALSVARRAKAAGFGSLLRLLPSHTATRAPDARPG